MTPNEFKAWFDGFTEAFAGCPTKAQWARIKARVAEIDGKPVTERIYVDRYWPTVVRTYPYWTTYCSVQGTSNTTAVGASASSSGMFGLAVNGQHGAMGSNHAKMAGCLVEGAKFSSSLAMAELGRAEAASLS